MAVVAMAVAMETAKLVTAAWLARRWRTDGVDLARHAGSASRWSCDLAR